MQSLYIGIGINLSEHWHKSAIFSTDAADPI